LLPGAPPEEEAIRVLQPMRVPQTPTPASCRSWRPIMGFVRCIPPCHFHDRNNRPGMT
jgi:hypothetical protein